MAERNVNCSGEESDMTAIRKHADCVSGGIDTKAMGNFAITCYKPIISKTATAALHQYSYR